MSFKLFLLEDLLLEGGRAIKGSVPLSQSDALKLYKQLTQQLKHHIVLVGSAGKKPKDAKSGDVDVAIECSWDDCKEASKAFKQVRELKGLGIISVGVLYADALRQVDLIPTANIAFCEWAYWNDKGDLADGLKGSHRNELLFACAKYGLDEGRYLLSLSKGLEKKDKEGARTVVATTPEEVCNLLLGKKAAPKNLKEAADLFLSDTYPRPKLRAQVVEAFFKGLKTKELSLDHPVLEQLSSVT